MSGIFQVLMEGRDQDLSGGSAMKGKEKKVMTGHDQLITSTVRIHSPATLLILERQIHSASPKREYAMNTSAWSFDGPSAGQKYYEL